MLNEIPNTINSRCKTFTFKKLSEELGVKYIKSEVETTQIIFYVRHMRIC